VDGKANRITAHTISFEEHMRSCPEAVLMLSPGSCPFSPPTLHRYLRHSQLVFLLLGVCSYLEGSK
jgi:hypothetical protein